MLILSCVITAGFSIQLCYCIPSSKRNEGENLLLLNCLKIKHVEFKKYILHVKLTVKCTVSFTCNIYFLNSTYLIVINFKSNAFSRFFCC